MDSVMSDAEVGAMGGRSQPIAAGPGSAGKDRRWWSRAEGRRDPGGVGDAPQTSGRPVETAARRVVAGVRVPGLDVDAVNPDRRRAGEAMGRRDRWIGGIDPLDGGSRREPIDRIGEHPPRDRMVRAVREPQELDLAAHAWLPSSNRRRSDVSSWKVECSMSKWSERQAHRASSVVAASAPSARMTCAETTFMPEVIVQA